MRGSRSRLNSSTTASHVFYNSTPDSAPSSSRVLQLDARFRAFKQGDLNVNDYGHRMKGMADDLRVLYEIVTDRHLIFNPLQGLNKRFDYMKIIKLSQL
jgi:hypothetical protein